MFEGRSAIDSAAETKRYSFDRPQRALAREEAAQHREAEHVPSYSTSGKWSKSVGFVAFRGEPDETTLSDEHHMCIEIIAEGEILVQARA